LKDENTIPALQENMFIFISQEDRSLPAECSNTETSKHTKNSIRDCFHYGILGNRIKSVNLKLNDRRNISINCYNAPIQVYNNGGYDTELRILYSLENPLHTVEIPAVNGDMVSLFRECTINNLILHGGDITGLLRVLKESVSTTYNNIYYPYWFDINTVPTNMRPNGNYIKFVPA
jgi:hypothetical protein